MAGIVLAASRTADSIWAVSKMPAAALSLAELLPSEGTNGRERSRSICLINILTATDEVMPSSSHSSANESLIDESTRTLSTDAAMDTSCMTLSIYYHTD